MDVHLRSTNTSCKSEQSSNIYNLFFPLVTFTWLWTCMVISDKIWGIMICYMIYQMPQQQIIGVGNTLFLFQHQTEQLSRKEQRNWMSNKWTKSPITNQYTMKIKTWVLLDLRWWLPFHICGLHSWEFP